MTHKSDRHVKALQRRHDYLQSIKRNDFDRAELSALNWALPRLKIEAESNKSLEMEEAFFRDDMLSGD
jgi:hypothetical protein